MKAFDRYFVVVIGFVLMGGFVAEQVFPNHKYYISLGAVITIATFFVVYFVHLFLTRNRD